MKILLFVNPFENAFFCFEDFTFRAAPRIRDIFPRGSDSDSIFRISFQGIINIMTFEAYPSYHNCLIQSGQFTFRKITNCMNIFSIQF